MVFTIKFFYCNNFLDQGRDREFYIPQFHESSRYDEFNSTIKSTTADISVAFTKKQIKLLLLAYQ